MSADSLIALRTLPKSIAATCYNAIRLALRRIANPLRVELPGHLGLCVILDDHVWLCVDGSQDDLPVLAWRDFEVHDRHALQDDVRCQLHLYHMQAGLVMGSALEALEHAVVGELARMRLGTAFEE
jgi:hypothetical protein